MSLRVSISVVLCPVMTRTTLTDAATGQFPTGLFRAITVCSTASRWDDASVILALNARVHLTAIRVCAALDAGATDAKFTVFPAVKVVMTPRVGRTTAC